MPPTTILEALDFVVQIPVPVIQLAVSSGWLTASCREMQMQKGSIKKILSLKRTCALTVTLMFLVRAISGFCKEPQPNCVGVTKTCRLCLY